MTSKDEYVQQLPHCSGCLQDFSPSQYPVLFLCKHIYCSLCLTRLRESQSGYHCLYDEIVTPAEEAREDISLYHRIDYFRRFVLTQNAIPTDIITLFDQLKKEVNYDLVPCGSQVDTGICPLLTHCHYNHCFKSIEIARLFRDADIGNCWECKTCMLTLTRKLGECPVCGTVQEAPKGHKMRKERVSKIETDREARLPLSGELSPTIAEEREGRDAKVRPMVNGQEEENQAKGTAHPPKTVENQQKKAKTCCVLQ